MEELEVVGCVAAIVASYEEASKSLQSVRERITANGVAPDEDTPDEEFQLLHNSLKLGRIAVQHEYDQSFQRLGRSFATGDHVAKNALKDIIFYLQQSLSRRLASAPEGNISVDFTAMRTASESSRDNTLTILTKLQQRLLMAAKIYSVPEPPSTPHPPVDSKTRHDRKSFESLNNNSTGDALLYGNMTFVTTSAPAPTKSTTQGLLAFIKRTGFRRAKTQEHVPRSPATDAPASNRKSTETVTAPGKGNQLIKLRSNSDFGVPRVNASNIQPFDKDLWVKPWEAAPPPPDQSPSRSDASSDISRLKQFTMSTRDMLGAPIRRPSTSIISLRTDNSDSTDLPAGPTEHWPSPANNFAGFCKGAYKLQQDIRGAFRLSYRPIGSYTYSEFWKCQKCLFEGVVHGTEQKKGFDTRVHESTNGLLYRWVFLAKSHAFKGRYGGRSGNDDWYRCIFCAAEGSHEDEVFAGKGELMNHLKEAHGEGNGGIKKEVAVRARCVVERRPREGEYFEICIPPREEIRQAGRVKAQVLDREVEEEKGRERQVVDEQEMATEVQAGQGVTPHVEHGEQIEGLEPTAQVVAQQGINGQEVDVRMMDGRFEQVNTVPVLPQQLGEPSSEDFRDMFERGVKVEGVC